MPRWRSPRPSSRSSGFRVVRRPPACPPAGLWEGTVDESGGSSVSLGRCLHVKAGVKRDVLVMPALSSECSLPAGLRRQVSGQTAQALCLLYDLGQVTPLLSVSASVCGPVKWP